MKSKMQKSCVWVTILPVVLIAGFFAAQTPAQSNAQERAASLRAQLVEVQERQAELQGRLQQVDDEIKPENIERSLAGIGSVHPEDLREARRRQLEVERRGLQSQLDTLAASRSRLETAIAAADAASYRQSAGPNATEIQPSGITPNKTQLARKRHLKKRKAIRR